MDHRVQDFVNYYDLSIFKFPYQMNLLFSFSWKLGQTLPFLS